MTFLKLVSFMVISTCLVECCETIFRLEGEVAAEDYRYYKIYQPGNILLRVETMEGDADVYVSSKNPAPNFEPENYDLHSATCGEDSIYLSKKMKRPIHVGIYGHFSYNQSVYGLEVVQMPETENHFESDELVIDLEDDNFERKETNKKPPQSQKSPMKRKTNNKNFPNSLWPFLELFEILFL